MTRTLSCRIAKQVATFYSDVGGLLATPPLSTHFDRSWASHVAAKAALYEATAQLQAATALHDADDIAPEIARLKVSTFQSHLPLQGSLKVQDIQMQCRLSAGQPHRETQACRPLCEDSLPQCCQCGVC